MKVVITGDIIQSKNLNKTDRETILEELNAVFEILQQKFAAKNEIYRGDGFQSLLLHPTNALRAALLLKFSLKAINHSYRHTIKNEDFLSKPKSYLIPVFLVDSRISIGIGEAEMLAKDLGTSDGTAFRLSGAKLDEMKNTKQRLAISTADKYHAELSTAIYLLDTIVNRCTALQSEVIKFKLLGYTENKIAQEINVGQSAVNQRSQSGGWLAIEQMIKRFETIYSEY